MVAQGGDTKCRNPGSHDTTSPSLKNGGFAYVQGVYAIFLFRCVFAEGWVRDIQFLRHRFQKLVHLITQSTPFPSTSSGRAGQAAFPTTLKLRRARRIHSGTFPHPREGS